MARTVNEKLYHADIAHQINLSRYSTSVVRRMRKLLGKTDADLVAQLSAALDRMPPERFTVQRLEGLLASVKELNASAYKQLEAGLKDELLATISYELKYQTQLFAETIPVQLNVMTVPIEQAYAAAMSLPFQGRLLSEWADSLSEGRMAAIRDAVRIGYTEGQTISQIVQRVRGTSALNYTDGVLDIRARNAEAIVRTAVAHTANTARQEFYNENDSMIESLRWTSTLDMRTSDICQARDGEEYPVDSGPRPPAHINCRSSMVPVLKSWQDLGFQQDELPESTRASMTGQVPEKTTYQNWLRNQPASVQNDILGPTKAKLFRDGGLTLDRFVDQNGHGLTLAQLRSRDAAAFARAGLQ